jgi:hypothetical protein
MPRERGALVPGGNGEIRFRVGLDPKRWLLLVPLEIATGAEQGIILNMVFDTGSPMSVIGLPTRNLLLGRGLLVSIGTIGGKPAYLLQNLRVQGQSLPDLQVLVSPRATRLGLDGILGLTFLNLFGQICFDVDSMELTLKFR